MGEYNIIPRLIIIVVAVGSHQFIINKYWGKMKPITATLIFAGILILSLIAVAIFG